MQEELKSIAEKARLEINQAESAEELKAVQVRYLGKKGRITAVLRSMGSLPAAERPVVGKLANQIRDDLIAEIAKREDQLRDLARSRQVAAERLDVTMPGIPQPLGHLHPLTLVMDEIAEIFLGMGFNIAEGPEVETDYYNFEALNIPKDHPARDMQDSFYFGSDILLRTHTSPVQVHTMVKTAPNVPVRIIAPGKVYRRDDDATHSPMFHQVEGLAIDRNISLSDLKGTLLLFVRQMFGAHQQVRLRPSFFPFTEPSAEVDMSCVICAGKGCRVCKETGWLAWFTRGFWKCPATIRKNTLVMPLVWELSGLPC